MSHPRPTNKQPLTAVCAVMWVQPTILAPAKGFSPCARFLSEIRADMSAKGREVLMLVQSMGSPLLSGPPRIPPAPKFLLQLLHRQGENSSALAWQVCAKQDQNTSAICHLIEGQGGVWDWHCLGKAPKDSHQPCGSTWST